MCGIYAIYYINVNINFNCFLNSLAKLQNRGHDSFGYSYIDNNNNNILVCSENGLVKDYLEKHKKTQINSNLILGHLRYITSGKNSTNNTYHHQPIISNCKFGDYSLVFNGNIPLDKYTSLNTNNIDIDTQLIIEYLNTYSSQHNSWESLLIKFIQTFERAYCIIIMTQDKQLFILRDMYGVRPCIYNITNDYIEFSSESNVFSENINNKEVLPGELLTIKNNKIECVYRKIINNNALCLFEYIYFANEDSKWNNISIKNIRTQYGKQLAYQENNTSIKTNYKDYIVIGIPHTGINSAILYAQTLNIPYKQYITKNTKINRTFILKNNIERDKVSKIKYIYNEKIKNKKIIIIDDSIVRGITIKNIIGALYEYGSKEVHVRICSPEIRYTCMYGIDIPTKEELLVNNFNNLNELAIFLKCDSINYLELEKIKQIMPNFKNLCSGCFNNDYKDLDW